MFLIGCSGDKYSEYLDEAVKEKYDSVEKEQRELLTLDNFKSVSIKFGYEIEEVKDFDKKDIKSLTFAKKNDHKIEYYIMKSNEIAINLFNSHKKDFEKFFKEAEKNHDVYNGKSKFTGENSDYFSVHIGNNYIVIYRMNSNFIYLKVDVSHKKEIKKILTELGCYKVVSSSIDCFLEATSRCCKDMLGLSSKSNKTQNAKFVKNTEQFKEIASKYGYKTYEECGLKSEDYKTDNIPIGPKIKNTITLLNGKEIIDMSSATFKEFENEKSVVEYVKEQKDFEAKHMKEQYLDLTIKEVDKGKAKRTIISTIYEVDTNKEGISDIVYIYSQHDNNLIEIIHAGANLETEYKMLDEMGY